MDIELFVEQFDQLYTDYPLLNIHLAEHMEHYYFSKYGRKPPDGWLDIIKERSRYWTVKTHVGFANREMVSLARSSDILPDFEFPLELLDILRITIVSVESPMVVYIRLMNYADEFEEMGRAKGMLWHVARPANLKQGSLYCVYMECAESRLYRLRLLDVPGTDPKNLVECELIDYGMKVKLEQRRLHPLHAKFMYLPAQAIKCNLLDEKDVIEASCNRLDLATRICQNLLVGLDFRAKFKRNSDDGMQLSLIRNGSDEPYNYIVLEHVKIILSPPPTLEPGKVYEIFVASIEPNGDCYARIKYPTLLLLKEFLSKIDERLLLEMVQDLRSGKLYLAKVNDEWHRARIVDFPNATNCDATLRLIDTNMLVSSHPSNLIEVHPQSDLNMIPEQAVFMNVTNSIHNSLSQMSMHVPSWKVCVLKSDGTENCPRVFALYEGNSLTSHAEAVKAAIAAKAAKAAVAVVAAKAAVAAKVMVAAKVAEAARAAKAIEAVLAAKAALATKAAAVAKAATESKAAEASVASEVTEAANVIEAAVAPIAAEAAVAPIAAEAAEAVVEAEAADVAKADGEAEAAETEAAIKEVDGKENETHD